MLPLAFSHLFFRRFEYKMPVMFFFSVFASDTRDIMHRFICV